MSKKRTKNSRKAQKSTDKRYNRIVSKQEQQMDRLKTRMRGEQSTLLLHYEVIYPEMAKMIRDIPDEMLTPDTRQRAQEILTKNK